MGVFVPVEALEYVAARKGQNIQALKKWVNVGVVFCLAEKNEYVH